MDPQIIDTLPTWQKELARRGILAEALKAGWKPSGSTWRYPVFAPDGSAIPILLRCKQFDSSVKPKYFWLPKESSGRPTYYLMPDTVTAIKQNSGIVVIASGEPDLLALRASGVKNALCWFGEGSVPETLLDDLRSFKVTRVEYYPDKDDTGRKSAGKIATSLSGSEIVFDVYALPGDEGSKTDLNRLWMDCKFNADKFWDILNVLPRMSIEIPEAKATKDPKQLPLIAHKFDDLPLEYYEAIERALGVVDYKSDGWSKPVKCPLKEHEHDKLGGYAAAWNNEKRIFSCLKCGETGMLAKDIGVALGLDWKDYIPKPNISVSAPPTKPRTTGKPRIAYSYREASVSVLDEINGKFAEGTFSPIPMPFRSLATLGGLCRMALPKKVIGVVADSGIGKTSFLEALSDFWRKRGYDGIFWGSEWSKEEYVKRSIQRYGGPSVERFSEHTAWHIEAQSGVPENKRNGAPFTPAEASKATEIVNMVNTWPGKLVIMDKAGISATELIEYMAETCAQYATLGRRIAYSVLDYAQLLRALGDKSNDRIDAALIEYKEFVIDKSLVGLVSSQIQKAAGREQANGNGGSQHDMQNARADYFNLVLTITRETDAKTGEKSPVGNVRATKNSLGSNGDRPLLLKTDRMLWTDVELDPRNIEDPRPIPEGAEVILGRH